MIALVILLVLAAIAFADETEEEPIPVTMEEGFSLTHCHPGDAAQIKVIPIPMNAVRVRGWFTTTNSILTLKDLSMLPSGLNRLEVQSICRGMTGEVTSVVIDLQRPPPPPKVARARVIKPSAVPIRTGPPEWPPLPPMPPGMAQMMPLPNAETNIMSYKDSVLMREYYSRPRRN